MTAYVIFHFWQLPYAYITKVSVYSPNKGSVSPS